MFNLFSQSIKCVSESVGDQALVVQSVDISPKKNIYK